jgi:hypothetical protein
MRTIIYLFFILFLASCGSSGGGDSSAKNAESSSKNTRSMEPPPSEKVMGCEKFKSPDDCVEAKEINFTLAYFLGSKVESQVYSLSKMDSGRAQITKIKTSEELEDIRKRFRDENYSSSQPGERSTSSSKMEDLVQFIQDDMEGQGSGRTALQVKMDRENAIREAEEKRKAEESEANKKVREKMQKELDTYPYQFEISCLSNIDDARLELELCGAKLKPTLKVSSENKIIYNYTFLDFISGTLNTNFRLPKEFSFELNSTAKDSSKLLVVIMKKRNLKEDPNTGKLVFGIEKVYTKMGQNLIFVP